VAISGDTGIEGDRITSNGQVKVTLSLANNLILIDGELLEVSANGATWVNATGNNKTWATADNAVTVSPLIATVCVPVNTLGALVSKV
jgi:hypothetical protein